MKKTMSRAFLLLLVLALLISAVPMVLAADTQPTDGSVKVTAAQDTLLLKDGKAETTVTVVVTPPTGYKQVGETVVTGATKEGDSYKFTTDTAGSHTVSAEATFEKEAATEQPENQDETTRITLEGSCTITVTDKEYTVTMDPTTADLAVGKSKTFKVSVVDYTGTDVKPASVEWSSSDDKIAAVADGVVTAKGFGTATITAKVKVKAEDAATTEVKATVNVGETAIEVTGAKDIAVGSKVTLEASLKDELPDGATVKFTFAEAGDADVTKTENGDTVTYTGKSNGEVAVTVHADVTGADVNIPDTTVYFGVYDSVEIEATTEKGTFLLSDKDGISDLYVDNRSSKGDLWTAMAPLTDDAAYLNLSYNDVYGKFSQDGTDDNGEDFSANAKDLRFTAYKTGDMTVKFTFTSKNGCTVYKGEMLLHVNQGGADIEYSVGIGGKVTFNSSDFTKFWNNHKDTTGSLSYVKFDGTAPSNGTLYADNGDTRLTKTMSFYPSASSTQKDLDDVVYESDKYARAGTVENLTFTAYGSNGKSVQGTLAITIGDTENDITSRGVVFGSKDYDITGLIEDVYKANTNKTLGYVTFPTLSSSTGKLFYNFSSILNSDRVLKNYEYYPEATGTQMDLDKVAFIPRAGLYGTVKVDYVAYDVNGKNPYEGTLTFNVTEKSKSAKFSDVNASSYSWAADAVDFLYYEGVANGSHGKYTPASNITRGDFMLMLYRAFLEEDYEDYNVTSNFPDVVKGSDSYSKETYQAVGVAKHLGIAQGTNGKYNPKAYITREEAMTLIYRTLEEVDYSMSYESSNDTSDFKDYSSVASYAKTAISDLIEHGVVVGTNGKINPKSNITRAEMAVILHRVLTY